MSLETGHETNEKLSKLYKNKLDLFIKDFKSKYPKMKLQVRFFFTDIFPNRKHSPEEVNTLFIMDILYKDQWFETSYSATEKELENFETFKQILKKTESALIKKADELLIDFNIK